MKKVFDWLPTEYLIVLSHLVRGRQSIQGRKEGKKKKKGIFQR